MSGFKKKKQITFFFYSIEKSYKHKNKINFYARHICHKRLSVQEKYRLGRFKIPVDNSFM